MEEFKDKIAIVTGAASGIGRAIAEKFSQEGMKVVISDIEKEALSQTEEELKQKGFDIITVLADVSKIEDVKNLAQKTIDQFGVVHILINNAGVGFAGKMTTTVWESPLSEWQWILGVNLWGIINAIHIFIPIMLKQDIECYIINNCSVAGIISPQPGAGIYSTTKHAAIALTESLQSDLSRFNSKIKVLALCPGFINTGITNSERNQPEELKDDQTTNPKLEQTIKYYKKIIADGISPEEVAKELFESLTSKKFYISTDSHQLVKGFVKNRMDGILKDFQK